MSVLTCMGKINGIFVNHDGIKKQVLSGWVNQNGVAVPFYKKGGGSGDFQVIWNASPWGYGGRSASCMLQFFNTKDIKKLVVRGTMTARKYSSSSGAGTFNLLFYKPSGNSYVSQTIGSVTSPGSSEIDFTVEFSESDRTGTTYPYFIINAISSNILSASLTIDIFTDASSIQIQSNGNGRNGTSAYGHNGLVFLNPDKLGTVKAEGTIQVGGSGTTSSYAYWNYSATKNGAASATTLKTISATYTSKTSTYVTSSVSIPNLNTADWTEYDPAFGLGTNASGSGNSSGPSWTGNVKYDVSKKTV